MTTPTTTPPHGSTFSREPVRIVTGIMAGLHIICGAAGLADLIGPNMAMACQIVLAAVDAGLAEVIVRPAVTPNGSVVEYQRGGQVYAGEGSELETDLPIREAGSLDMEPAVTMPRRSLVEEADLYRLGHDGTEDAPRREYR